MVSELITHNSSETKNVDLPKKTSITIKFLGVVGVSTKSMWKKNLGRNPLDRFQWIWKQLTRHRITKTKRKSLKTEHCCGVNKFCYGTCSGARVVEKWQERDLWKNIACGQNQHESKGSYLTQQRTNVWQWHTYGDHEVIWKISEIFMTSYRMSPLSRNYVMYV